MMAATVGRGEGGVDIRTFVCLLVGFAVRFIPNGCVVVIGFSIYVRCSSNAAVGMAFSFDDVVFKNDRSSPFSPVVPSML